MTETPLTVASLVDEVLDAVHGYSRSQEERTSLTSTMGSADLTFSVSNPSFVSRGAVQIDDELVQVAGVDVAANIMTVEPWGRAQGGTTAASHAIGAQVTTNPLYPRQRVRNAIYGVLREIFPQVYGVAETLLSGSPIRTNYPLPADCYHVIRVETQAIGGSQMWAPVMRWRQNKRAASVELEVLGPVTPGSNRVRVQYMRTPPVSLNTTDDLSTLGYDYQLRDLIVLGATAKLLAYTEPARVQAETAEAMGKSESVPAGSAMAAARALYQMFVKRVDDERQQLLLRYPVQHHWTR